MPRKTKEINEEKPVKKESKLNKKIDALIKTVFNPEEAVVDAKKTAKKTTKKAASSNAKSKTAATKTTKAKSDKTTAKEKTAKSAAKTTAKEKVAKATAKTKLEKATAKKTTKAKTEDTKKKTTKKATKTEKADKSSKTTKKATAKSAEKSTKTTKKTSTKKATKAADEKTATKTTKTSTKATAKAKSTAKKSTKVAPPTVVEYYDLPYRYNQTVVKVLYQNPTTLFVYWEISDSDIENYKKQYGDNFFETTRPVLVVYNDTMNYSFEVDINDFANSWYFGIRDSKCNYRVELIRRPVFYNEKINVDYIHITSSNKIETPNDRILFSTDEPYTVYFRNTKNNNQRKVNLPKLLEQLNLTNKDFGFPIVRNVYDLYKNIYHIEDVGEFSISLTNASSGNPSSHSLSSRFI